MAPKRHDLYQIRVTLNGAKPPIWRKLLISSTTDLAELHDILQIVMGWTDSHLHQFIAGDRCFGVPNPDFLDDIISEEGVRIDSLLKQEKQWITYEYDFGDGWEHKVLLEKITPYAHGETVPKCTGGRRRCPPEDVGGIRGYMEFLEVLKDKTHPEHDESVEWAGEYFDPEHFDPTEVNEMLLPK